MALDIQQELEALVAALAHANVDFALCGGIAVTIHGAPRLTDDLDILVPADHLEPAKKAAASVGFDIAALEGTEGDEDGEDDDA